MCWYWNFANWLCWYQMASVCHTCLQVSHTSKGFQWIKSSRIIYILISWENLLHQNPCAEFQPFNLLDLIFPSAWGHATKKHLHLELAANVFQTRTDDLLIWPHRGDRSFIWKYSCENSLWKYPATFIHLRFEEYGDSRNASILRYLRVMSLLSCLSIICHDSQGSTTSFQKQCLEMLRACDGSIYKHLYLSATIICTYLTVLVPMVNPEAAVGTCKSSIQFPQIHMVCPLVFPLHL